MKYVILFIVIALFGFSAYKFVSTLVTIIKSKNNNNNNKEVNDSDRNCDSSSNT